MRFSIFPLIFLLTVETHAQVIDVNGDQTVGAEEAIAVAELWKQEAKAADDHDHLGQTWIGNKNPLRIRGNFPPLLIIGSSKPGAKLSGSIPSAPLILENTAPFQNGFFPPDLLLLGSVGVISAESHDNSDLQLKSSDNIELQLDADNENSIGDLNANFVVKNGERISISVLSETGAMFLRGDLITAGESLKLDHPQDPANKYLSHSSVESPERKNVYDGVVTLVEEGEALVQLPDYFEAFNSDFRYQLTPIGSPAPNLYVAEEIQDNEFKIAGGTPGMKISWQVTGIRQDAYAKANPVEVEQEKLGEEKGKYLHPELYGEPVEMSVGLASEE